jgi:hypothetical protein
LFVRYDYSSGIQFHNKSIPTSFTIFENGRTVVEARTLSVAEPPAASDPVFDPAGLTPLGSGRIMYPGVSRAILPLPVGQANLTTNPTAQVVILRGSLYAGKLSEIEVLASSDPALNQEAVKHVGDFAQLRGPSQPGATLQSSEQFFTVEFVPFRR